MVDWSKTAPKRKQKRPADHAGDFDDKVGRPSHAQSTALFCMHSTKQILLSWCSKPTRMQMCLARAWNVPAVWRHISVSNIYLYIREGDKVIGTCLHNHIPLNQFYYTERGYMSYTIIALTLRTGKLRIELYFT